MSSEHPMVLMSSKHPMICSCGKIDQRSWQIFNNLFASGGKLLDFHDFKGGYLYEEVTNLHSSKETTYQSMTALSNGEGLNKIGASLNF